MIIFLFLLLKIRPPSSLFEVGPRVEVALPSVDAFIF